MARDAGNQSYYPGAHGGSSGSGQWSGQWHPEDADMILSKKMSQVLRHTAAGLGLEVLHGGFVRVRDLLEVDRGRYFAGYTEADIIRVVRNNDKQRFGLGEDDRAELTVRANQGHTGRTGAAVDDEALLTEVTSVQELESKGEVCVHGTYWSCWESIRVEGLKPMGRNHVHFAIRAPEMGEVVSGMRASCELLIFLDVGKALADGLRLYRSSNGVLLSRGFDGIIPTDLFQRVVQRWQNKQIWPPPSQAPRSPPQHPKPLGERRVPGLPPAGAAQGGRAEGRGAGGRGAGGRGSRAEPAETPRPPSPEAEVADDWEDLVGEAESPSSAPSASTPASRQRAPQEASPKVCTAEAAEASRPARRPARAPGAQEPGGEPAAAAGVGQGQEGRRAMGEGTRRWSSAQVRAANAAVGDEAPREATHAVTDTSCRVSMNAGAEISPEQKKELRNLEKKLREIASLEGKLSNGAKLDPDQEMKVSRKADIENRIQQLRGTPEFAGG